MSIDCKGKIKFCIFLARNLPFCFVAILCFFSKIKRSTVFYCKLSVPICYFAYVTIIHVTYAYKINTIHLYNNEQAVRLFSNGLFNVTFDCQLVSFPRLRS